MMQFILRSGGAIFIHAFGAYFGLAVSMMHRHRDVGLSGKLEGSSYSSDIFSLVCRFYQKYFGIKIFKLETTIMV